MSVGVSVLVLPEAAFSLQLCQQEKDSCPARLPITKETGPVAGPRMQQPLARWFVSDIMFSFESTATCGR